MNGDPTDGVKVCSRCGTASQHVAWCPKCGLNLRPHTPTHEPSESSPSAHAAQRPPTAQSPVVQRPSDQPLRDLWERLLHSPSGPVVGIGALVAILVLVIVLLSSGGGGHSTVAFPSGEAVANPTPTTAEPTQTEEASTTPTTSATTVESSQVETVLKEYEQDYSSEDLETLKGLFAESLTRKNGPSAPEDLQQAIGTYEHQFSELKNPSYSLSELKVQPGSSEASASGRYSISSQTGTVTGSIDFHLVEQNEKLLIDKITVEPSK